jgi:heterodisulfide reductase subunit A-like polyferredoxin/coenzyme F420-reducing hydrogenase delta subunit
MSTDVMEGRQAGLSDTPLGVSARIGGEGVMCMAVGLYLSGCRGSVTGVLDLDALAKEYEDQAAIVRVVPDFFDPTIQERIVRDIADAELDSIVLAGHSLDHYLRNLSGRLFHDQLVAAGLNPSRIAFVSLAEQIARPHRDDPQGAMRKARAMLDVALMRATTLEPLPSVSMVARQSALVFGATIEGLVAAQRLLQLGYRVVLADRGDGIDQLRDAEAFHATLAFVEGHPDSETISEAHIVDGLGWVGDYEISLASGQDVSTYHIGGMLLAQPDDIIWVEELRQHFRLDVDDDGHARTINPATHPAETVEPGLMAVPTYGDERQIRDKVAAADSAAIALALRLSQPETIHYIQTSSVDESLCGACASCVKTCAFGACHIDEDGVSHVDPRRCRACGKCVVSCPVGARDIISCPHEYMIEAIDRLARVEVSGARVLSLVCGGCGNPAMNAAADVRGGTGTYPASLLPLWIPCSGRLDALYVLRALKVGFDGVMVFRCREGHCHNLIGNLDMDRRINLLRTVIRSRGIDDSRLQIVDINPFEGERFAQSVNEFMGLLASIHNGKEEVSA